MQTAKCDTCGLSAPLGNFYYVNLKLLCEQCAQAAPDTGQVSIARAIDNTVCSTCAHDNGSTPLALVSNLPFCEPCREKLYQRGFPQWLKLGLAGLVALLVFALIHGIPFFKAGWSLAKGERLMGQRQYPAAVAHLTPVVAASPDCERCVLLLAKAYLLTGDVERADAVAQKHNGGRFEKTALLDEVNAIMLRANRAEQLAAEAGKLAEQGDMPAAIAKLRDAQRVYPELPIWNTVIRAYEAGAAFDAKDYDSFLSISEELWRSSPDAMSAGQLASAIACKYAVTGDSAYRSRAEEMLEKARSLSVTEEQKKSFAEYEERIRYRLDKRDIISKAEYQRRFRADQGGK